MKLEMVVAVSRNGVIGQSKTNNMPWPNLPADMARFKETTMGAAVVMGRKTWESIPEKFRPLSGRRNIVLTRNSDYVAPGAEIITSRQDLEMMIDADERVCIIGGGSVYDLFFPHVSRICLTRIEGTFKGDVCLDDKYNHGNWSLEESQWFAADKANKLAQTFMIFDRVRS